MGRVKWYADRWVDSGGGRRALTAAEFQGLAAVPPTFKVRY
jgi:hypothetical protein